QIGRVLAIFHQTLLVCDEHGHLCAILAEIKMLLYDVIVGIEGHIWTTILRALLGRKIIAEYRARIVEGCIRVEGLGIVAASGESTSRPNARKRQLTARVALEGKETDLRVRILQI